MASPTEDCFEDFTPTKAGSGESWREDSSVIQLSAASAPSLREGRSVKSGSSTSAVYSKLYDSRGRGVFLSGYLPT